MAKYSVEILPSVLRHDFSKLPKNEVTKIMERIKSLSENPRPTWSKKLSGREEYRARQGNYRILYIIEEQIRVIQVTKVGHRRNIYS